MLLEQQAGQHIAPEEFEGFSNQRLSAVVMRDADQNEGVITHNGVYQIMAAVQKIQSAHNPKSNPTFFELGFGPGVEETAAVFKDMLTTARFHFLGAREVEILGSLGDELDSVSRISLAEQSADELDNLVRSLLIKEKTEKKLLQHLEPYERHVLFLIGHADRLVFWLRGYGEELIQDRTPVRCEPIFCSLDRGNLALRYQGKAFRGLIKL